MLKYSGYARIYRNFIIWVADNSLGNGGKDLKNRCLFPARDPPIPADYRWGSSVDKVKVVSSLTIIIPLLKETDIELFEGTLVSILENRPEEDDILVVNAAGYENSYDLTQEDGVVFCTAGPETGLIDALNIGVRNSDTPFICPVLCGCSVGEDWADPALLHFEDDAVSAVIPKLRKIVSPGRELNSFGHALTRDGVLVPLRSGKLPAGSLPVPGMGGTFFRRRPVLDLGLFQPELGIFALADMAFLIRQLGGRVDYEPNTVLAYDAAAFPALSQPARLTAQERLYTRWSEIWTGAASGAHGLRLFKEKLFGGGQVRRAYAKAKEKLNVPAPGRLLAAARQAGTQNS